MPVARKIVVVLSVLMALNFSLSAKDPEKLPQDPRITKGALPNGLTYYIVDDEQKTGTADFYLLQKSGILNEEKDEPGFSEIIARMAFRGTRNFPDSSIESYLKSLGLRPGAGFSSSVYPRYTEYSIRRVPISDPSAIDSCLLILYDWSCFVDMDEEALNDGYISPEGRAELSASETSEEMEYYSMFEEGLEKSQDEIPSAIKAKMLKRFYYKWYRPDLQSIVIVGNIETDAVKNKITSLFSSIPKSRYKTEAMLFSNITDREDVFVSRQNRLSSARIDLSFAVRSLSAQDRETSVSYLQDYMMSMYCDLLGKRLYEQAGLHSIPVEQVQISTSRPAEGDEFFILNVGAEVLPELLESSFALMTEEVARLGKYGFTPGEFQVASSAYLENLGHDYLNRKKFDGFRFYDMCRDNFLYGVNLSSIEMRYTLLHTMKDQVGLDLFNDFSKNLVSRDFCKVGIQIPEASGIEVDEARIREIYSESWDRQMLGYLDREYIAPKSSGKAGKQDLQDRNLQESVQKEIQYESVEPVTGADVIHLNNGISLVYLRKDISADRLMFKAVKRGGASLWKGNDAGYKVLNDLVDRGGISNLSSLDLSRYMESRGFRIRTSILPNVTMIDGCAPVARMDEFLSLLKVWMTDRRVDDQEFQSYGKIRTSEYESGRNSVCVRMKEIEADLLYEAPCLHTPLTVRELEQVDYPGIVDFYRSELGEVNGYDFFFVGNMDVKTFKGHVLPMFTERKDSVENVSPEKIRPLEFRWKDSVCVLSGEESIGRSVIDIDYISRRKYNLETVLYSYLFKVYLEDIVRDAEVTLDFVTYPVESVIIGIEMDTPEHQAEATYAKICSRIRNSLERGVDPKELESAVLSVKAALADREFDQKYWIDVLSHLYVVGVDMHSGRDEILDAVTPETFKAFIADYFENGAEVAVMK